MRPRVRPCATRGALVGALALAALAAVPPSAGAAPEAGGTTVDTTPPVVTLPPPRHVVGSRVASTYDPDWGIALLSAQRRLHASAADDSGICGFTVQALDYTESLADLPVTPSHRTTWSGVVRVEQIEGSSSIAGYGVRVDDCAGNTTTVGVATPVRVIDLGRDDPAADGGGWTVAATPRLLGGSALRTRTAGAAVEVDLGTTGAARDVALVMTRGPGRGRATVLVDGKPAGTVDTRADRAAPQTVVWSRTLPPGAHVLTVVNQGTPGRARIDVDGVLL